MQRRRANPRFVCPKCGKPKHGSSEMCHACRHEHGQFDRVPDVIKRMGNGQTLKEIAFEWQSSLKTVEYYWAIAKVKFGFQSPCDATKYAIKMGWIEV